MRRALNKQNILNLVIPIHQKMPDPNLYIDLLIIDLFKRILYLSHESAYDIFFDGLNFTFYLLDEFNLFLFISFLICLFINISFLNFLLYHIGI